MTTIDYQYRFNLADDKEITYALSLDADTLACVGEVTGPRADWTRLDFHQCENCPLDSETTPHCLVALRLSQVIADCSSLLSYDTIDVRVISAERVIQKKTTAQQAISSLMGLIMPCSGCPHTRFFRPMARFHLPFSSEEETFYRVSSMYMLAQLFKWQRGETPDYALENLKKLYADMHQVNRGFSARLRAATNEDASVNAVIILDLFAKSASYVIEDSLAELRYLFAPYLEDSSA